MKTKYADKAVMDAVLNGEESGPIAIVNLLKFHEGARYPEGAPEHGEVITGREAYERYAKAFMVLMGENDAHTAFYGESQRYLIGQGEWDAIWVNHFPSRAAFKAVTGDPRYREIYRHREAGLDYQDAIVTTPVTE